MKQREPRHNISTNTVKGIRKDYAAGVPVAQIAKTYDIAPGTVYIYTKDLPKRNIRIPAETRQELIRDYYMTKVPVAELCKEYGVSQRALYYILTGRENAGDPERQRSASVRLTLAEIRTLLSFTEGVEAFDRIRKRLQKAMEWIEEEGQE